MRIKGKLFIWVLTLLLIPLMLSTSSAEIPETITVEGYVSDSGIPIDDKIEMSFTLYDSEKAEVSLWTQRQVVEVKNGKYSIVFSSFPNKALSDAQYYIGIEVQTEEGSFCLGRKRLVTVTDM